MSLNNNEVSLLLTNCIDLPGVTVRENMLLREMAHQWGMGTQAQWGSENRALAPEVAALFNKLRRLVHVPQSQV